MSTDVEIIMGGLFTAFCLGWSVGKQFLIFRKTAENIT